MALWIEALEPGKPLSFLDARIRPGDSLIGIDDHAMLEAGIPDAAYKPLTGDDKDAARAWMKLNRAQRDGKAKDGMLAELRPPVSLVESSRAIAAMAEDTLEQIEAKRRALARLHAGSWQDLEAACNLYVAAFFAPKTEPPPSVVGLATSTMPLTDHVWRAAGGHQVHPPLTAKAAEFAYAVHAFHWPLEFPDVLARGGFDVVVGNPPWKVSQLAEAEYFAARSPEIAALPGDDRKRKIANLEQDDPRLWSEYVADKRVLDAANEFHRASGRFDLTAVGKINTYALSAEPDAPAPHGAPHRCARSPRRSWSDRRATIHRRAAPASP